MNHSIRAQTTGFAPTQEIFLGKEYLVVPVIAMVEGVRFGANQNLPELGLASEFGKILSTWNNRPLMVNHPKIDGQFVSANFVNVLESYSFGFTADAQIDDNKLKMNAWIDLSRAAEIPEVQAFVDKINAGEMIEVSVGFMADVEPVKGLFNNQKYSGIWRNIIPDHLAFLVNEPGACSIEDGCGVPRINQAQEGNMTLKTDSAASCGCGGTEPKACTCNDHPPEVVVPQAAKTRDPKKAFPISVQTIAATITSNSIISLLQDELPDYIKSINPEGYYFDGYVISFTGGTDSMVIYQVWESGAGYCTMGILFDIAEDGTITFKGDPVDVRVVSHVYTEQETADMAIQTKSQETVAAPVVQAQPEVKVLSRDEALKTMSPADQALVLEALGTHQALRDSAITTLKANPKCKFNDAFLSVQSLDTLQNLVSMSEPTPVLEQIKENQPTTQASGDVLSFAGRAAPTPITAAQADNGFIEAPKVFAPKQSA